MWEMAEALFAASGVELVSLAVGGAVTRAPVAEEAAAALAIVRICLLL